MIGYSGVGPWVCTQVCPPGALSKRGGTLSLEMYDPVIYNKFPPGPLDQRGQCRSWGRVSLGGGCLGRYARNVNGLPEWRASEIRLGLRTVLMGHLLWPRSLIATVVSQEWSPPLCKLKLTNTKPKIAPLPKKNRDRIQILSAE